MVEIGPDKGRRITVPELGARIGRSSQNDIELTDPSISRFQCRVFFKPDGFLWIADLGSTNETLVNTKPVLESRLNLGDTIEIGESIIRVIADNLKGMAAPPPAPPAARSSEPPPLAAHPEGSQPAYAPPPAFAPLAAEEPSAPGGPTPAELVDLGLVKKKRAEQFEGGPASSGMRRWLWLLLVMMVAVAAVAVVKSNLWKPGAVGMAGAAVENTFSIYYEKVNGSVSNIFRYALVLENEKLSVQIDSLLENRHVSREKKVAKDVLDKLKSDLDSGGFFKLAATYQGLQPNVHESADLEVAIGPRHHRSILLNRLEPDEFKHSREMIEEFAKNELGLITISLSPERLVEMARDACLQGQKLYGEREVKYANLWAAIHAFEEAKFYLDTIEPKPEFHKTVINGLAESHKDLKEQLDEFRFQSEKSRKLQDWKTAAENLRIILEMVPDGSIQEYSEKYRVPAEKELIDVERRLDRKGKR